MCAKSLENTRKGAQFSQSHRPSTSALPKYKIHHRYFLIDLSIFYEYLLWSQTEKEPLKIEFTLCYSRQIIFSFQLLQIVNLTERRLRKQGWMIWLTTPAFDCDWLKRKRNKKSTMLKCTLESIMHGIWKAYANESVSLVMAK